ncbi:MAG TPA: hypothetical protein VHU88_01615 [Sporichthyaceae bacterium]|jgi:hypothetical protein|nr:hypothetical protein [Sporichthyaceae bacterium]
MRTTPPVAVGTAVVLTAVATWSLAQTGGAVAAADGRNLEFFIQDTKQATVDSPPTGTSQGDLFAYHGLIHEKKGGKTIGRFGGACVQLDAAGGAPSDSSCSVDYIVPDGQLHTEIFGANDFLFSGKSFVQHPRRHRQVPRRTRRGHDANPHRRQESDRRLCEDQAGRLSLPAAAR